VEVGAHAAWFEHHGEQLLRNEDARNHEEEHLQLKIGERLEDAEERRAPLERVGGVPRRLLQHGLAAQPLDDRAQLVDEAQEDELQGQRNLPDLDDAVAVHVPS
jgi:hypothetical protein